MQVPRSWDTGCILKLGSEFKCLQSLQFLCFLIVTTLRYHLSIFVPNKQTASDR